MTGDSIDYEDLLRRYSYNKEQAANDLERYLLRDELPSPGSVARAIVTLREKPQEEVNAYWKDGYGKWMAMKHCSNCGYQPDGCTDDLYSNSTVVDLFDYCPSCGARIVHKEEK